MDWATATGVGSVSAGLIVLIVAFVLLVRRCLDMGQELTDARNAQLDAEHFKREAEEERDDYKVASEKATAELESAKVALAAAKAAAKVVIDRRREELQEQVDAGKDDDLVALSHRVFGNALSKAGAAGDAAAASSGDGSTPVPHRASTI